MVPGRLLPLAPAELLHQRDRSIPRGRPRAVPRDGRRPGRWDDDRRTPRPRRFVDGDRVIGGVSGDAHERALDRGEQIGRTVTIAVKRDLNPEEQSRRAEREELAWEAEEEL